MKYKPQMKHYRPGCLQYQTIGSVESTGFWQATKQAKKVDLTIKVSKDSVAVNSEKRL